jgi:hypothetical protein
MPTPMNMKRSWRCSKARESRSVAVDEDDYLILTWLGVDVELAFLDDLAAGTLVVDCLDRKELGPARDLMRRSPHGRCRTEESLVGLL